MKRPAFFVSRLYGAIAGHDGQSSGKHGQLGACPDQSGYFGTSRDNPGRAGIMADSQGPGETMTGKERGYPMHGIHTHPCPSIVLLYCYTFRQN